MYSNFVKMKTFCVIQSWARIWVTVQSHPLGLLYWVLQVKVETRLTSFWRSWLGWRLCTGRPISGSCWRRSSKMIPISWSLPSASSTRPRAAFPTVAPSASRWLRKQCWGQLRSSLQWSFTTVTPSPRCFCAGAHLSTIAAIELLLWFRTILNSYDRFLNPQCVTPVKPGEDVTGIHNFDIFIIQVVADNLETNDLTRLYRRLKKVRSLPAVTMTIISWEKSTRCWSSSGQNLEQRTGFFRSKFRIDDKVKLVYRWRLMLPKESPTCVPRLNLKFLTENTSFESFSQLCEAMDTSSLESVTVYECISSEGATANPLKVGFLHSYLG